MRLRIRWEPPVLLTLVTGLFWLALDAADVRAAVLEGLELCRRTVIPSLFPFLVVSSLLLSLGFGELLSGPLSALMRPYGIGGAGASALVLGLVGGYPVGARSAAELWHDGLLTRDEAERLLAFVNNANPAFLINVLGLGVFGSIRTGLWLWLIHLTAALLAGLLAGRGTAAPPPRRRRRQTSRCVCFSAALVNAVRSAAEGMLGVCAFVVFFYVLALPLRRLTGTAGTVLTGLMELFSAVPRLHADRTGFVLASGLAGFGGGCVLCQTLSVLAGSGLSVRRCVLGKALQGCLAALLAAAMAGYVLP